MLFPFRTRTRTMSELNTSKLREEAEKKVLTYLAALGFEQKPSQWAKERGLVFLTLPTQKYDPSDPGKTANVILIDFDNEDPSIMNGNYLTPNHRKS